METNLKQVLQELYINHLTVKPDNCEVGRKYIQSLGHVVGNGQIAVPAQ